MGTPEDQRDVAEKLTQDCLSPSKPFTLLTRGEANPTLDEAKLMGEEVCNIVLEVRGRHGLTSSAESTLVQWMRDRIIRVENQNYAFSVEDLEQWLDLHDNHFLPAISQSYLDLILPVVDRFSEQRRKIASARIQKTLRVLISGDSDARNSFWEKVSECSMLNTASIVQIGYELADEYSGTAGPGQIARVVVSFSSRICEGLKAGSNELDEHASLSGLVALLNKAGNDYKLEDGDVFTKLSDALLVKQSGGSFATTIASILLAKAPAVIQKTIASWVQNAFTNIPQDHVKWLAENITNIDDIICNTLLDIAHARLIGASNPLSEGTRIRLQWFADALPSSFLTTQKGIETINRWLAIVQGFHTNPNQSLENTLPVVVRFLKTESPSVAATFISTLYGRNKPNHQFLPMILAKLKGHWPKREAGSTYDAEYYFDQGISGIQNSINTQYSGDAALSLMDLFKAANLGQDREKNLSFMATAIWQHRNQEALEILKRVSLAPEPDAVALLSERTDFNVETHIQSLCDAWNHIKLRLSESEQVECSVRIAQQNPKSTASDADASLSFWVDALGDDAGDILNLALNKPGITDAQRKRIWLQIERRLNAFPTEIISKILVSIFLANENSESAYAIGIAEPLIVKAVQTMAERHLISSELLNVFRTLPRIELKRQVANLLRAINAVGALEGVKWEDGFSLDDVQILQDSFPTIRALKKRRQELEIES